MTADQALAVLRDLGFEVVPAGLRAAAVAFADCQLCSEATGTLCGGHRAAVRAALTDRFAPKDEQW